MAGVTLIGGAASIGRTDVVHFMIDSDFNWILLATTLLWVSSLQVFWPEDDGRMHR